ncbi:MAG: hypothetical protein NT061_07400 [Spirochaetes bacterium]|nr:hypothetical protein [Spirochaetota bacterium]
MRQKTSFSSGAVLVSAALLGALLASCATTPQTPSWVLASPPPDGSNTWFVGSAAGADAASATNAATSNLIVEIMQYIGVDIKVQVSSVTQETLNKYSEELRQTIEVQSSNRIAGFKVKEKFVQFDKTSKRVTVYILASYLTADLNKEKARIAALFQEKSDAVAKPEAEGDALAASGKALEAADRYVQAMVAASGSDIENAEIKLERNADKARLQIASLSFILPGNPELKALLGKAPAQPFELRLVTRKGGQNVPIPGASITLSYPRKLANGKLGTKAETLVTDQGGMIRLVLPAPDFVGKGRVYAQLDLSSALELLDKVPKKYDALISALEDEIRGKTAEVTYVVSSQAASIAIALFVVDIDERGIIGQQNVTQTGLMETLGKEGFTIRALALDPALVTVSTDQLIALTRNTFPSGMGRLAFGSGKIVSVRKEGAFFVASASGSLKVVDLTTGQILYASEKSWQALASDEATARRNALKELGSQVFGKDLLSSLP